MPAGRPSTYSPAYCNEVIECLAEGHSITAFAGRIGVARTTVFNWMHEHPEFMNSVKIGQAKATSFWESILVNIARTSTGNATAAIFGLKNRAADDWRDRIEHAGTMEHSVDGTIESLMRRIAENGRRINERDTG